MDNKLFTGSLVLLVAILLLNAMCQTHLINDLTERVSQLEQTK